MTSARLCLAALMTVVIMKMAAATQGQETNWLTSDIMDSTTLPYQTYPTDSDLDQNSDFLRQVTEKLFKQGDSALKSMQKFLVKFQHLVSAGSNPLDPVPTTTKADVMRTPSGGVTTPDGDTEKRSNTTPVSKNDILREIIRRIREEAAENTLELPIGIRFIEQPSTTLQTYNSDNDIPEKRDADRDAVRDEILRRLLELQRVKLPGMRAGK